MARNGDVMRSDRLKQVMQQIDRFRRAQRRLQSLQQVRLGGGVKGLLKVAKLDNGSSRWDR